MRKEKRLNRIMGKDGRCIILPLDHGMTLGPIDGINDMKKLLNIVNVKVDSVILHRGLIKKYYEYLLYQDLGLIMHLSSSTEIGSYKNRKILTETVEEALAYGCDGVSVHINFGNEYEAEMLKDLSDVVRHSEQYGVPVLGMMYCRNNISEVRDIKTIRHMIRVAEELGVDIVKIAAINGDLYRGIVKDAKIPIVVAGGEKTEIEDVIKNVQAAITNGITGVSIGRNVFQNDNVENVLDKLINIVHTGCEG